MEENLNAQLSEASKLGDVVKVGDCLDKGADIEFIDEFMKNPMLRACFGGHVEVVELLIKRGANINLPDCDGWTPLMYAREHVKIINLLIKYGADIESRTHYGSTALYLACKTLNSECIEKLLENGANIDVCDNDIESLLDFNIELWSEEHIQELIISKQPQNIKFFDDKIGILPSLKEKYMDVIELSLMGLF